MTSFYFLRSNFATKLLPISSTIYSISCKFLIVYLWQWSYPRQKFSITDLCLSYLPITFEYMYRSGTSNMNTLNSKFHLILTFCKMFATFLSFHVYNAVISTTANSKFHLIKVISSLLLNRSNCKLKFFVIQSFKLNYFLILILLNQKTHCRPNS